MRRLVDVLSMKRLNGVPDLNYLCDILRLVWSCTDDQHTIKEIDRKPVRAPELGPSNPRHTTIAGHDNDRSEIPFQRAIQERETFNVKHMHLINEEDLQVKCKG